MSKNELVAKIEALNEWEAVIEEAKAEAEAIRDSIKAAISLCGKIHGFPSWAAPTKSI